MPNLPVVVPWRPGCPHRDRAWAYVWTRHLDAGHDVRVGRYPPGELRKAAAVADGLAGVAGLVVIADADVWCDGIPAAVDAVRAGAAWAVPHRLVHRLTADATDAVLAGGDLEGPTTERPYRGQAGGGIVVTTTDLLDAVPLDPRFEGWGQEDEAWEAALLATAGRPWRGDAPLWHLWHPPQPRMTRHTGSKSSRALWKRYRQALRHAQRGAPGPMERLLEEARRWQPSSSS